MLKLRIPHCVPYHLSPLGSFETPTKKVGASARTISFVVPDIEKHTPNPIYSNDCLSVWQKVTTLRLGQPYLFTTTVVSYSRQPYPKT